MRISKLRRLAAGTVVSCVCALAAAEAASAVPAVWSPAPPAWGYTTRMTVDGPVTIKIGTSGTPETIITCYPSPYYWKGGDAFNSGSPLTGSLTGIGLANICSDDWGYTIWVEIFQGASNLVEAQRQGTTYSLRSSTSRNMKINSAMGQILSAPGQPIAHVGLWTNGTSSSKVTYNNSPWGKVTTGPLLGQIITVTGTFTYKSDTGSSLKLV